MVFSPIEKLDPIAYRTHLAKSQFFVRSCEYAYANLCAWSKSFSTTYALTENALFLKMEDKGVDHFLCPITPSELLPSAFKDLESFACQNGHSKLRFVCLPHRFAEQLKLIYPQAVIFSDQGTADYIYTVHNLSTFPGKALHAKKNHRNKFFALYGDNCLYRTMTPNDLSLCLAFNEIWYTKTKAGSADDFTQERIATERMLSNFEHLGLCGGMLFVNGKLCAYTVASDSFDGSDTLIIHVEKGLHDVPGVYPAICSEFLLDKGSNYTFVNREDDLNNEGLRKSKLSYQPVGFEEKFSAVIPL